MGGRRFGGSMRRYDRAFLVISSVVVLAAIGCGDAENGDVEDANGRAESVAEASDESGESDAKDSENAERFVVESESAPEAIGPYSQAVGAGDTLFLSGQLPMDPDSGEVLLDEDIATQTHQILTNLEAVLEESGLAMDDVVSTSVFMVDLDDFDAMNDTYDEFFGDEPPARATVEVSNLPAEASVEISAIAYSP